MRMFRHSAVMAMLMIWAGVAHATSDDALIKKGEYLAVASDCTACHTASSAQPFAGGKAIVSPVGDIIATNITPSKTNGIGNYSE